MITYIWSFKLYQDRLSITACYLHQTWGSARSQLHFGEWTLDSVRDIIISANIHDVRLLCKNVKFWTATVEKELAACAGRRTSPLNYSSLLLTVWLSAVYKVDRLTTFFINTRSSWIWLQNSSKCLRQSKGSCSSSMTSASILADISAAFRSRNTCCLRFPTLPWSQESKSCFAHWYEVYAASYLQNRQLNMHISSYTVQAAMIIFS